MTTGSGRSGVFLYDPDCGFCTASVEFLRRHLRSSIDYAPYVGHDLAGVGLTEDQCRQQAWVVLDDGRTAGGAMAFAEVLSHGGPAAMAIGRLLRAPGARQVAQAVYRFVARHRHRLPGGTGGCRTDR